MPALRLHLNENTGGCSPAVLDALRSLTAEDVAFYPAYEDVERETADHLGIDRSQLALVNGLDEGLHVVAALALRPDAGGTWKAIIPQPAFERHELCTLAAGGRPVRIAPGPDFAFPARAINGALEDPRARLLYVTNPHNPTGLTVPASTIAAIAAAAPHVTVLVDEAYIDFGGESLITHLDAHRNVIVGRTFAKAYGLAALRAGALVAHAESLAQIRAVLPPYNLNVAAAAALRAAIRDRAWRERYVRESAASRQLIYAFFRSRDVPYYESAGNFVLVRIGPDASRIVEAMAALGILLRDRSTQPGCQGCVRITAGMIEHTERCLSELARIL